METITLKYGSTPTSQAFNALSVKGFDPIDDVENFPDILHHVLDGSLIEQNIGQRRHFQIEIGARELQTYANRLFIANFWKNPIKLITYTHDSITETDLEVVKEDGDRLEADWIGGYSGGRTVTLKLQEQILITSFPA